MKYLVIVDVGIDIAGVHYTHGTVFDTADIVPKVPAPPEDAHEEIKAAALQKQADLNKQAKDDLAAIVEAGNLVVDAGTEG